MTDAGGSGTDSTGNGVDSTSFASILANVQRMRNETGDVAVSSNPQAEQFQVRSQSQPQPLPQPQPQPEPRHERRQPTGGERIQRPPQRSATDYTIGSKRVNAFNQDRSSFASTSAATNRGGIVKPSSISVNKSQTGNPLLKHIINVNWSYVESRNVYDYMTSNREIIFLSMKYHKLHPEYIGVKMKPLVKKDAILLVVVDVENTETIMKEINKVCLYNEFTLLVAFSFEQAAKYLTSLASVSASKK